MFTVIDLFAGAGGLSLGFQQEGDFKIVGVIENNKIFAVAAPPPALIRPEGDAGKAQSAAGGQGVKFFQKSRSQSLYVYILEMRKIDGADDALPYAVLNAEFKIIKFSADENLFIREHIAKTG